MKTHEIELNGERIQFKYRSIDCINLEKEVKKPLLQYVQGEDMTMCINLLLYAKKFENEKFSKDDACELYDKLIDAGWTFKQIIQDIIYETLVVSGFLTKKEWEEAKKETEELRQKLKKKMMDTIANT